MSVKSELSRASEASRQLFSSLSANNNSQLARLQGDMDENFLATSWAALGQYISKQLRVGRAVNIPKFGQFTFSAPDVSMAGTTNAEVRESERREPVFVVSKEFVRGASLTSAVWRGSTNSEDASALPMRPLVLSSTSGRIQTTLVNWSEVAQMAQLDHESVRTGVARILRKLAELCCAQIGGKKPVLMEIPAVGVLVIKNGLAAVRFSNYLCQDVRGLLKISVQARKEKCAKQLSREQLAGLPDGDSDEQQQQLQLNPTSYDDAARDWLSQQLRIDVQQLKKQKTQSVSRSVSTAPLSSVNSLFSHLGAANSPPERNTPQTGTRTNSPSMHSQASSQQHLKLLDSVSQRGQYYARSEERYKQMQQNNNNNNSHNNTQPKIVFSLSDVVLKKMRSELRQRSLKASDAWAEIVQILFGINATRRSALNLVQFRSALDKLSYQLPQHEVDVLYEALDSKGDRLLDHAEFVEGLEEKYTPEKLLQDVINKHHLNLEDVAKYLGISNISEQNGHSHDGAPKKYDLEALQSAFRRVPLISHQDAKRLAQSVLRQNTSVDGQQVMQWLRSMVWCVQPVPQQSQQQGSQQSLVAKIGNEENPFQPVSDWKNDILERMRRRIQAQKNQRFLIEQFEKIDVRETGVVPIEVMQKLLERNAQLLGVTHDEIQRLMRYLDKDDREGNIDYFAFHRNFEDPESALEIVAKALNEHLSAKKLDAQHFLTSLVPTHLERKKYGLENASNIPVLVFAKLCAKSLQQQQQQQQQGQPRLQRHLLAQTAPLIDIDRDGFIDKYDLETFLSRYHFLPAQQQHQHPLLNQQQQYAASVITEDKKSNGMTPLSFSQSSAVSAQQQVPHQGELFPTMQVAEAKLANIVRQVKQALQMQNVSLREAYHAFDEDGDGFITFTEFSKGLDLWLKLSFLAKQAFFSYLDTLKIGMFDFKRWENVMKRYVLDTSLALQDNWHLQESVLHALRQWYKVNGLDTEQAFRIIDHDFDGFISKDDLRHFLVQTLKLFASEELLTQHLDRLFKLMDTNKRGAIQKADLAKILSENIVLPLDASNSNSISSNSSTVTPSLLASPSQSRSSSSAARATEATLAGDWQHSACQQMALRLTRKFNSIEESFNTVSEHQPKIGWPNFKSFIIENRILEGFNLTEQLLQKLFAHIDVHKKGFITLSDWQRAFSQHLSFQELPIQDIRDAVAHNFTNIEAAFNFFAHADENTQTIDSKSFARAMKSLFQHVYSDASIEQIWKNLLKRNQSENKLKREQFIQLFGTLSTELLAQEQPNSQKRSTKSDSLKSLLSHKRALTALTSPLSTPQPSLSGQKSARLLLDEALLSGDVVLNRFKELLTASGRDLEQVFEQADEQQTGMLSNVAFRNALQRLNLGMKAKDLDLVVHYADTKSHSNHVRWRDFLRRLRWTKPQEAVIERARAKVQRLKEDLYKYMLSPKDAFRACDERKAGNMDFDDFQRFLFKLARLKGGAEGADAATRESYAVQKDLFDFIDIRRDGKIDMDEWMQTFARFTSAQTTQNANKEEVAEFAQSSSSSYRAQLTPSGTASTVPKSAQSTIRTPQLAKRGRLKAMSLSDFNFARRGEALRWEQSREYDAALQLIGKNRNYLLEQFRLAGERENKHPPKAGGGVGGTVTPATSHSMHSTASHHPFASNTAPNTPKAGNNSEVPPLKLATVKDILRKLLDKHRIDVGDDNWKLLIGFAEKRGLVDVKFLLEVYRQRLEKLEAPPPPRTQDAH